MLYRNSYYFGDAYWSVYSANASFRASFLDGSVTMAPLEERGVVANAAPLGLVRFGAPEQTLVCFVFTLSPGQTWGVLEGGFDRASPPSGIAIYDVTPSANGDFCVGYDPRAVRDWDAQTTTYLRGYTPNPKTFNTWLLQAESAAPFQKLFPGDSATAGRCSHAPVESPVPASSPEAGSTGGTFPPVFPDVLMPPLNP